MTFRRPCRQTMSTGANGQDSAIRTEGNPACQLGSRGDTELLEYLTQVVVDGGRAYEQLGCYFAVGIAAGDQTGDLRLLRREMRRSFDNMFGESSRRWPEARFGFARRTRSHPCGRRSRRPSSARTGRLDGDAGAGATLRTGDDFGPVLLPSNCRRVARWTAGNVPRLRCHQRRAPGSGLGSRAQSVRLLPLLSRPDDRGPRRPRSHGPARACRLDEVGQHVCSETEPVLADDRARVGQRRSGTVLCSSPARQGSQPRDRIPGRSGRAASMSGAALGQSFRFVTTPAEQQDHLGRQEIGRPRCAGGSPQLIGLGQSRLGVIEAAPADRDGGEGHQGVRENASKPRLAGRTRRMTWLRPRWQERREARRLQGRPRSVGWRREVCPIRPSAPAR